MSLLLAAKHGNTERAKYLLERELVDPDTREPDGERWTALHVAAEYGQLEVVKLLVAHRANVNAAKEKVLGTPLHCAAWNNRLDVAKYLMESGADVDARSIDNRVPLHYAAMNQHMKMAALLVEFGCDVNAVDSQNVSPLDLLSTEQAQQLRELAAARQSLLVSQDTAKEEDSSRAIPLLLRAPSHAHGGSGAREVQMKEDNFQPSVLTSGGLLTRIVGPFNNGILLTPRLDNAFCALRLGQEIITNTSSASGGDDMYSVILQNISTQPIILLYLAVFYSPFHHLWLASASGLQKVEPDATFEIGLNRLLGGQNVKWFALVYNYQNHAQDENDKSAPKIQRQTTFARWEALQFVAQQWKAAWPCTQPSLSEIKRAISKLRQS